MASHSSHAQDKTTSTNIKKRPPYNQRLSFWLIILLIIIVIGLVRHHETKKNSAKDRGAQKASIKVEYSTIADVPIYLYALGTVTPTYSVTVHTQINGQLMSVRFTEGQMVKAGQLLAEIDSRPYEAQLLQYKGQLERDQAQLVNARIDLKRYQKLWKEDSVAQQVLATQEALVKQLEGTIKLDEGLLETTKVNLIYCNITSPIDGRIGLRLVDPGNIVQPSDTTGIAVINMLHPITVVFTVPEDNIQEIMQRVSKGTALSADAFNREQTKLLAHGKLLAVDNQVDPTTGTVKLKAQFQNEQNVLFPSQFVNVRLLLKTLRHMVTVPTAAVQNRTSGNFVYVLNQNATVSVRPVVVGVTMQDRTSIVSGLSAREAVATVGIDQLTDGAKVTVAAHTPHTQQPANKRNTES